MRVSSFSPSDCRLRIESWTCARRGNVAALVAMSCVLLVCLYLPTSRSLLLNTLRQNVKARRGIAVWISCGVTVENGRDTAKSIAGGVDFPVDGALWITHARRLTALRRGLWCAACARTPAPHRGSDCDHVVAGGGGDGRALAVAFRDPCGDRRSRAPGVPPSIRRQRLRRCGPARQDRR